MSDPSFDEISSNLASMALNEAGVPSPIGAMIIGAIFPSGDSVPSYFNQVFAAIQQIVADELTQNDIDTVNATVSGTVNFMKTTYAAMKANPAYTKADLAAAILPYVEPMFTVIATLGSDRCKQTGFGVFLVAGSLLIALLQEQALQDVVVTDPWTSAFTASVVRNATSLAATAAAVWPVLQIQRRNCVTVKSKQHAEVVTRGGGGSWSEYWCEDSVTGTQGAHYGGLYDSSTDKENFARALADSMTMQTQMVAALVASLGVPDTIIATWNSIAGLPLPLPSIATVNVTAQRNLDSGAPNTYAVTWTTANAVSVLLDTAAPLSGTRVFVCALPSLGAPFTPPDFICYSDKHGRQISQALNYQDGPPLDEATIAKVMSAQQVWNGEFGASAYYLDLPAASAPQG